MENPFELILERLVKIEKSLEVLKNQYVASENDTKELLSCIEAAEHLNMAVSSIYGLVHRKAIPYYKTGKKLWFKKSEIDNWIFSKKVNSTQEINHMADEYLLRGMFVKK